jgi:hypothetical protein
MVSQDFGPVAPQRPAAKGDGRRRVVQVGTVCAAAACLAALFVVAGAPRRAVRMTDDSLEATTIGIDHNAMLAGNTQQNAAFLQTFGSYLPNQGPTLATGTTQLSQQAPKPASKQSAASRLNAKLAAQMQAQLTAGTQGDSLMTPHFVAALEQATGSGRSQMLAQQQALQQKSTLDALTMTQSKTHILPKNMRQQYAISSTKNHLGAVHNLTPQQAAMRMAPMGDTTQALASASNADSAFLGAEPAPQLSAKQLIAQAALKQMNSLPAPAPPPAAAPKAAPVQQLAQYPQYPAQPYMAQQPQMQYSAVPQYAPMQGAPMQMAYQQRQYAPTQMAYQMPAQPQPYTGYNYEAAVQPTNYPVQQAPTQEMYQMASPVKPNPYQALPQAQQMTQMTQQMPQQMPQMAAQPYIYDPAQSNVNTASPAAMMAYSPQQQPQAQLAQAQPAPASVQATGYNMNNMGDTANVGLETPAEIGAAAASKVTAPPSWKDPDMSLKTAKGSKGNVSPAAAAK